MLPTRLHFMVRELSDKHLAAINRGRKKKGLKPIRRNKKVAKSIKDLKKGKPLNPKSQKKVNRAMADLRKKGLVK